MKKLLMLSLALSVSSVTVANDNSKYVDKDGNQYRIPVVRINQLALENIYPGYYACMKLAHDVPGACRSVLRTNKLHAEKSGYSLQDSIEDTKARYMVKKGC